MSYNYKRFASSTIILLIRQLHTGAVNAAYKSDCQCAGLRQMRLTRRQRCLCVGFSQQQGVTIRTQARVR